jgi:hypothetical protein
MSYMRDLDEYTERELYNELDRRQEKRDAGFCDYCGRLPCQPSCKFPERHKDTRIPGYPTDFEENKMQEQTLEVTANVAGIDKPIVFSVLVPEGVSRDELEKALTAVYNPAVENSSVHQFLDEALSKEKIDSRTIENQFNSWAAKLGELFFRCHMTERMYDGVATAPYKTKKEKAKTIKKAQKSFDYARKALVRFIKVESPSEFIDRYLSGK